MRALFDISVLLALFDQDHIRHAHVRAWYLSERKHGWASCPLSQNGFLRIVSQRSYSSPRSIADALLVLRAATTRTEHAFWPEDISILDPARIDHAFMLGPKQITDVYLLALAVKNNGRLVTLDTAVPLAAAKGAKPENLVAL